MSRPRKARSRPSPYYSPEAIAARAAEMQARCVRILALLAQKQAEYEASRGER